jgi:hypothetical protein
MRLKYETPSSNRQPWEARCCREVEEAVDAALAKLSPDMKMLVLDRFYRGLSVARIASENGMTVNSASASLHDALRLLRLVLMDFAARRWDISRITTCRICRHPRKETIESLLRTRRKSQSWGAFCKRLERAIGERIQPPQILIAHLRHMTVED